MKDTDYLLLVEDDITLGELTKEMLSTFGISVFTVTTLEEAVEKYRGDHDNIPIVIMDMNLEHATGIDVYHELLKISPDFVPILASGMITSMDVKNYKEMGFQEIVQKPYSFKSLLEIIRKY